MSKVVRLNDNNIGNLEKYRNKLIEYYSAFTTDKTYIEYLTNLNYNDLIKSALENVDFTKPFP